MIKWVQVRIDRLKSGPRTIERARIHGGHVATGFMWAAGVVILGGPLWLAAAVVFTWILAVETRDTWLYTNRRPFPWNWSEDSWWDAFQMAGGASFVLIGWWFFLLWLAVYFITLPRQT